MSPNPERAINPRRRLLRPPIGRAALSLLPLCLLLASAGCGADEDAQLPDERIESEAGADRPADPMDGLQLTIGLDQAEHGPGDPIEVTLQLSNHGTETRTLSFPTGQRFDLILTTEGGAEIARWSDERSFTQALGEERIEPGGDGPVWEAELPAPDASGTYQLEALVLPIHGELRMTVPIEVIAR